MTVTMRVCVTCANEFEARHNRTIRCSAECRRKAHNESEKARSLTRKEQKAEYDRIHYAANREKRAQQKRDWYLANLPKSRAYYADHKGEQLRRNAERRIKFPDEARTQRHRRRAITYGADARRFSQRDADRARNRTRGMCGYCTINVGEQWDHRVPLIRGGSHAEGNLTWSCAYCNQQKHAKTVTEWRVWRRRAGLPDLSSLTVL